MDYLLTTHSFSIKGNKCVQTVDPVLLSLHARGRSRAVFTNEVQNYDQIEPRSYWTAVMAMCVAVMTSANRSGFQFDRSSELRGGIRTNSTPL